MNTNITYTINQGVFASSHPHAAYDPDDGKYHLDTEIDYYGSYSPPPQKKINNHKKKEDPEEALCFRVKKHNERERQLDIQINNIDFKERELDKREAELNKKEIELLFRERCVIEKEEREQYGEDEVITYKGFGDIDGTYNRRTGRKVEVKIEEKQTINKPVTINEKYMKLIPKRKVYNKSQYYMSLLPKKKN